jgi:hypothetical protein
MYIWIKPGVDVPGAKVNEYIGHRAYLSVEGNIANPLLSLPPVPDDSIDSITHRETIYRGFRNDGMYQLDEETVLTITTHVHSWGDIMDYNPIKEVYQSLEIIGKSVESMRKLYCEVRSGKKQPDSDWLEGSFSQDSILESQLIERSDDI